METPAVKWNDKFQYTHHPESFIPESTPADNAEKVILTEDSR